MDTPADVNCRFLLPAGQRYVGSVSKQAQPSPDNAVKRQPKPKPLHPRRACIQLMRLVIGIRRTVFGVLPRARRVRAANDPEA